MSQRELYTLEKLIPSGIVGEPQLTKKRMISVDLEKAREVAEWACERFAMGVERASRLGCATRPKMTMSVEKAVYAHAYWRASKGFFAITDFVVEVLPGFVIPLASVNEWAEFIPENFGSEP